MAVIGVLAVVVVVVVVLVLVICGTVVVVLGLAVEGELASVTSDELVLDIVLSSVFSEFVTTVVCALVIVVVI